MTKIKALPGIPKKEHFTVAGGVARYGQAAQIHLSDCQSRLCVNNKNNFVLQTALSQIIFESLSRF